MSTQAKAARDLNVKAWTVQKLAEGNLVTCFVFAGLARTELDSGNQRAAERSFGQARTSHEAVLRFLARDGHEEHRLVFQAELNQIDKKLDDLKGQILSEG
jgi:hypothetical protein